MDQNSNCDNSFTSYNSANNYYFDEEKWKRDARYDGRGHSLSSYDGAEYYETVFFDGQNIDFYIYRIN